MAMDENPYRAPEAMDRAIGVRSGRREDLRSVAVYQKGILVCILISLLGIAFNIFALATQAAVPPAVSMAISVLLLVVGLASAVFVILLAIKVYNIALGIVLGLLSVLPCIGLIVLLVVNGKATRILQSNGHRVGLAGCRPLRVLIRVQAGYPPAVAPDRVPSRRACSRRWRSGRSAVISPCSRRRPSGASGENEASSEARKRIA